MQNTTRLIVFSQVTVGPGLTFSPATITAANGTVVEFDFSFVSPLY
jgi:hypothetical protein